MAQRGSSAAELGAALTLAEQALRAHGLTGSQAFDALLDGLEHRLGVGADAGPIARAVAQELPLVEGTDLFGLAYERFFADLFKGLRGQFFTPAPLVRLLLARLPAVATVLDPTCGSGGILVAAGRTGAEVRGIEIDPRLARLAALNLRLAGARGGVACADFFLTDPEPADVVDAVVANPPFSVPITDRDRLDRFDGGRGRSRVLSDHLFLEAVERWVRPGGWAALVLPFSIVANRSAAVLRERVDARWVRHGLCALPEGVFRPFGGAAGRAVLVWLRRRPTDDAPCAWAELADPGYDVRGKHIRTTSSAEVDRRCAGDGWTALAPGSWSPEGRRSPVRSRTVRSLARLRPPVAGAADQVADLADVVRPTGELVPREAGAERSPRVVLHPGDVLVARLRPNLGNVVRVPVATASLVGSPEWIALQPGSAGGWLAHALRAPAWRDGLPPTTGQTRPRLPPETVLDTVVAWPGDDLAERVDRLSTAWMGARARLKDQLEALQDLVDAFSAGTLDEAGLSEALAALEQGNTR